MQGRIVLLNAESPAPASDTAASGTTASGTTASDAPASGATKSGTAPPSTEQLAEVLKAETPFWLDLAATDADTATVLRDVFGFHPLAVAGAEDFGQRPKIDTYPTFTLVVAFGLSESGTPIELHAFCSDRFVVTVHDHPLPQMATIAQRIEQTAGARPAPIMVLYRVLDALVDDYFPVLDAMDEDIDRLEDQILRRPTDQQLGEIFGFKRRLVTLRRLASEQRDMFGSVLSGGVDLPGLTPEAERYFRDLYDHLVRISQTADSYRDLLSAALDTHLSTTSNRLNVVMKQLAIIATVFLPLSFVTGFFGQNFAWLVDRIGGAAAFWVGGVGLQIVIAVGLLVMFRAMGWLGDRDRPPDPR